MSLDSNTIDDNVIHRFIAGDYEQMHCKKCEMTFLTNVYSFDDQHVLLEKRSLGLEYYCGAIQSQGLTKVPNIHRVGILDEEDNIVESPSQEEIYSGDETDLRFIYIMEKLQHLDETDSAYFDKCTHSFDWKSDEDRKEIIAGVAQRYNPELADDIVKLYHFYKKHEKALAWDLHGDNLMQRIESGEVVILDPYTRRA